MTFRPLPLADYLRRTFTYTPEDGKLYWNWRDDATLATNKRFAGKEAGSFGYSGLTVRLKWNSYLVSRIIFVILYGDCLGVGDEIDHADLDRLNNKPENLRKATHIENNANKELQSNNTSGAKGVARLSNGTWRARIGREGTHLGCFKTFEEAVLAHATASEHRYGEFRRVPSLPM